MFATIESTLHRWRRRVSRSEWAIRHLGLTPSEGTAETSGILLIQIDGLARRQLETAVARGRMPYLRRLLRREHYALHTFYPGLPSTTPAVQAELYYGVRSGVPAFSFLDRERGEIALMYYPECAKRFEAAFQEKNEGLLAGGSSWSNIYTGGAAPEESHFCGASLGLGDMWRTGKIGNIFIFILLNFAAVVRIAGLLLLELAIGIPAALRGIFRGQQVGREFSMILSRTFVGVGLRELVAIGAVVDVTRGLPIVHVNLLGYDELSHRRGPGSRFAHWSLLGIDRAVRQMARAAHRSTRRDYQVWIFSDHGQERVRSFATEFPDGVEGIVRDCLDLARSRDPAWRPRSQQRPVSPPVFRNRLAERRRAAQLAAANRTPQEAETFTVAAMGPVGLVYFAQPMDDAKKRALALRLVAQGRIPGVLLRTSDGRISWYHAAGETAVPGGVPALLHTHPEALRAEIAQDLVGFMDNPNTGDLVLLGWGLDGAWTFAAERGAHAGPGPDEMQGFVLTPAGTLLPEGAGDFIRPSGLRAAARHVLGQEFLPDAPCLTPTESSPVFRVMTYNVHHCSGMDGRVSPRRIARIIGQEAPDLVALQEIDQGRSRSRSEDQAALIAAELGYQYRFCPTVSNGEQRYGHALLSRWPILTVKTDELPNQSARWWPEARRALWARILVNGREINVVTTHLGLSPRERLDQMRALLGPEWLGPLLKTEPVVLCGDLNLAPGSAAYGLAASRLRDVQVGRAGHPPRATFSSTQPFMRIDHIFVSAHFDLLASRVPRSEITRVASDHLPLLADLSFCAADAEMPIRSAR
jgi:endonuclease/exonuclease/phosphatase family metal-dependent hydrolase